MPINNVVTFAICNVHPGMCFEAAFMVVKSPLVTHVCIRKSQEQLRGGSPVECSQQNVKLSDLIKPGRFDDVVNAVKKVLQNFHFDQGVQNVATPSLCLKIGHSLKKCINILQGHALRTKDKDLEEDVDNFEKLIGAEWSYSVWHHSLSALSTKKFNKVDLLPLAEDLEKLRKSALSKMSSNGEFHEERPHLVCQQKSMEKNKTALLRKK